MVKKLSKHQLLSDFRDVHGDRYNYSLVEYKNSRTKVCIICPDHGIFEQTPNNHKQGMGCKRCAAANRPQCQPQSVDAILERFRKVHGCTYEYDNLNYINYHTEVNITCKRHGCFKQLPYNHISGNGCPTCYEDNKLTMHEDMMIEPERWLSRFSDTHGGKYVYPKFEKRNATSKIAITCPTHGVFNQALREHALGKGCPKCGYELSSRAQLSTTKEFVQKSIAIHGDIYDYNDVDYTSSHKKVSIRCKSHGVFEKTPAHHLSGQGCPSCATRESSGERELAEWLTSIGVDFVQGDRSIISPYELDIVIPDHKLAIEYCGLYWHSTKFCSDTRYHRNKTESCEDKGYRLVTIFEDEWIYNKDKVLRVLSYFLGNAPKGTHGRKLNILEMSSKVSRDFLDKYHLQGKCTASHYIGATHNDELVAIMAFGSPTRQNSTQYELKRFVTNGCNYPGIASRLFKYFVKNYDPREIVSFSDRRWFDGGVYKNLGFKYDKIISQDYSYVKRDRRYHKSGLRKERIEVLYPEMYDSELTEREMTDNIGYLRIYDCGKVRWLWTKAGSI